MPAEIRTLCDFDYAFTVLFWLQIYNFLKGWHVRVLTNISRVALAEQTKITFNRDFVGNIITKFLLGFQTRLLGEHLIDLPLQTEQKIRFYWDFTESLYLPSYGSYEFLKQNHHLGQSIFFSKLNHSPTLFLLSTKWRNFNEKYEK